MTLQRVHELLVNTRDSLHSLLYRDVWRWVLGRMSSRIARPRVSFEAVFLVEMSYRIVPNFFRGRQCVHFGYPS
jgi:hypothetical protein